MPPDCFSPRHKGSLSGSYWLDSATNCDTDTRNETQDRASEHERVRLFWSQLILFNCVVAVF